MTINIRRLLPWLNREANWWKIVALFWLFIILFPVTFGNMGRLIPATFYYDLKRVEVTNDVTPEGERIMSVDRTIRRNFYGEWHTSEEILTSGGFSEVRNCNGSKFYRTDKALPKPVTLEWWIGLKTDNELQNGIFQNCALVPPFNKGSIMPVGKYRICTTVRVFTNSYGVKDEHECSDLYDVPNPVPVRIKP